MTHHNEISEIPIPDGLNESYILDNYLDIKMEYDNLIHPYIIILPLNQDAELLREYLYKYLWKDGILIWQNISRYGSREFNVSYNSEIYLVILISND